MNDDIQRIADLVPEGYTDVQLDRFDTDFQPNDGAELAGVNGPIDVDDMFGPDATIPLQPDQALDPADYDVEDFILNLDGESEFLDDDDDEDPTTKLPSFNSQPERRRPSRPSMEMESIDRLLVEEVIRPGREPRRGTNRSSQVRSGDRTHNTAKPRSRVDGTSTHPEDIADQI